MFVTGIHPGAGRTLLVLPHFQHLPRPPRLLSQVKLYHCITQIVQSDFRAEIRRRKEEKVADF